MNRHNDFPNTLNNIHEFILFKIGICFFPFLRLYLIFTLIAFMRIRWHVESNRRTITYTYENSCIQNTYVAYQKISIGYSHMELANLLCYDNIIYSDKITYIPFHFTAHIWRHEHVVDGHTSFAIQHDWLKYVVLKLIITLLECLNNPKRICSKITCNLICTSKILHTYFTDNTQSIIA